MSRSSGDEDPNAGAGGRQAETVGTGTKGELYFKLIIQKTNQIQKSKTRKIPNTKSHKSNSKSKRETQKVQT